jgi:hypothetical protein
MSPLWTVRRNVDPHHEPVLYWATMSEELWWLEIRIFTVHPGTRDEFDRISSVGTVPLMRRLGIDVVAHGPSLNNDDGYYLLRAFRSEEERVTLSQSLYTTEEWETHFDAPVTAMIADYRTAVMPATPDTVERFRSAAPVAGITRGSTP